MANTAWHRIQQSLDQIYGPVKGRQAYSRIAPLIEASPRMPVPHGFGKDLFSAADVVLITYGDSLLAPGEPPLETLRRFAETHLKGCFSDIHILPFYPFSSDDGFSVTDFCRVDERLGDWNLIHALGGHFGLMFDLVLNHVSAQSDWFQSYLAGMPGFADLAIEVPPQTDLRQVVRPRTHSLLTRFEKQGGEPVHVWTTFSTDQVDLNYRSLDVLAAMVDVLLCYVRHKARLIRLDAVAFLWKEIGTDCLHRPQTHAFVKLLRAILDHVAPHVLLITETNVPHQENISYFGTGGDEAQMVYNFSLPPLLLHTFQSGDATLLGRWVESLRLPSEHTTFFNFCASHDGVGVRPLEGLVGDDILETLVKSALANGGRVSYKSNPDGTQSPYELNISYVDALKRPGAADPLHTRRFLASQAIQYVLPGVPATYIHSLLGSRNWDAGVRASGIARRINRQKLDWQKLQVALEDPGRLRHQIFWSFLEMIRIRVAQPAFHPKTPFEILDLGPRVFGIQRRHTMQTLYALTNIREVSMRVDLRKYAPNPAMVDLIDGQRYDSARIPLGPYQYRWLVADMPDEWRERDDAD